MTVFEQPGVAEISKGSAENLAENGRPLRRWPLLLAALLVVFAVLLVLDEMAGEPAAPAQAQPAPALVSYVQVTATRHAAQFSVLAEVKPRWQTSLKAFVRGEVREIAPLLREGHAVRKGELLLRLQDSTYQAALAEAEQRLRRAEVGLLQTQREAQQAQRNWQRAALGETPNSPLALQQPQLRAAQAEVRAAQAALTDAKTQLAYTQVRAPYDGVIVSRSVNPGDAVEVGQPLVELLDAQQLDIPALLDEQQWQLLAEDWPGGLATVSSIQGDRQFPARMLREGGQVEHDSRLRRLYLSVEKPLSGQTAGVQADVLRPGELVRVQLPGRGFDNLLRVPQSAHTRDGYIWYLDADDRLQRYRVQPLFSDAEALYLPPPEAAQQAQAAPWRIVLTPLSSFVPGTVVAARLGGPQPSINARATAGAAH
jgi:RND family efflux transporter MFP subunit